METAGDLSLLTCVQGCKILPDKEVVFVPCVHIFCSSTCRDMSMMEITGKDRPFCMTCLQKSSPAHVKKNVALDTFLPRKSQNQNAVTPCASCIMDDPVVSYCEECNRFLCDACSDFHRRLRGKQDHHLVTDLERRKQMQFELLKVIRTQCDSDVEEAIYYCRDCKKKLCETCMVSHGASFASHKVININDMMAEMQSKITEKKDTPGIIDLSISKLEENLTYMKEVEWAKCCEKVDEVILKDLEILRDRQKILLDDRLKQHGQKFKPIENQIKLLYRAIQCSMSMNKVPDDVIRNLDKVDIIIAARTALPQMDSQNQMQGIDGARITLNGGNLQESQSNFPKAGSVETNGITQSPVPDFKISLPIANQVLPTTASISTSPSSKAVMPTHIQSDSQKKRRLVATISTGGRLNTRPLGMPHLQMFSEKSLAKSAAISQSKPPSSSSVSSSRNTNQNGENREGHCSTTLPLKRIKKEMREEPVENERKGSTSTSKYACKETNMGFDKPANKIPRGGSHSSAASEKYCKSENKISTRTASALSSSSKSFPGSSSYSEKVCCVKREIRKRQFPDCGDPDHLEVDKYPKTTTEDRRGRKSVNSKRSRKVDNTSKGE